MTSSNSLSGNYGLMDETLYMRKMEVTCLPEAANLMDDYNRQELKDLRPVNPTIASGEARGGVDPKTGERRGGFQSAGALSLRYHGKRNKTKPDLPDGTFLDWQFLEKDPRSIMNQPDMRKHREQQEARGKFIKFYSDEDFSIPEKGITPMAMNSMIRQGQRQTKERLKIFDTSKTGFHTGNANIFPKGSVMESTKFAHQEKNNKSYEGYQSKFSFRNRSNKTSTMSNDTSIGWKRGVDHEFKVSQYGRSAGATRHADSDWYKNRANTYNGHEIFRQVENKNIPKATAMMIVELTKLRKTARKTGAYTLYGEGKKNMTLRKKKLIARDIAHVYNYNEQDRRTDPHADINGEQLNLHGSKWAPKRDSNRMKKVVFNPKIIKFMQMGSRKNNYTEVKPIKDKIKQTAKDSGVYIEERPHKSFVDEVLGDVVKSNRESLHNFPKGQSKSVHTYSNQFKTPIGPQFGMTEEEEYKKKSAENMRKEQTLPKYDIQNVDSTVVDLDFGRDDIINRHQGLMGSKFVRNKQVHKFKDDDVNDI